MPWAAQSAASQYLALEAFAATYPHILEFHSCRSDSTITTILDSRNGSPSTEHDIGSQSPSFANKQRARSTRHLVASLLQGSPKEFTRNADTHTWYE